MHFFSFDVESVGLYGDPLAFGYVIVDENNKELEQGYFSYPIELAKGTDEDRNWVSDNVLLHLPKPTHRTPKEFYDAIWNVYSKAQELQKPIEFIADCGYPVEANFFRKMIKADLAERKWKGPYPLHEIGTMLKAAGMNPLQIYNRLDNEKPTHHPTCDARQSARLYLEAHAKINKFNPQYLISEEK